MIRLMFGFRLPSPSRIPGSPVRMSASRTSLCLRLPAFELRLELVRSPELDATSVALLAPGDGGARQEIAQASERAGRAGVRPGMTVSRAVALCPGLTLLEPDPAHYNAAMEAILDRLSRASPVVESVERGCVHVGVDGLDRLLGSPREQVDRILELLFQVLPRPVVAAFRAGRAPGTFAAQVASRAARPGLPVLVNEAALTAFLARQPMETLPLSPRELERLHRLDLRTLGDVGRLPEAALLRHLGRKGRTIRALARGEQVDPVTPAHRPEPIRVLLDLPAPTREEGPMTRALERMIDRILAHGDRQDRSLRALRLAATLEEGGSWTAEITLRTPSARRADLLRPLAHRVTLRPPPRAVTALELEAFDFGPSSLQTGLFDRSETGARPTHPAPGSTLAEAIRELKLRLGHAPLYRVVELEPDSRIPERRHALLALEEG
ncbi:MAG: DNA polymerase Y family protein [Gemmatimonadales bacterium]|nr:MAG: DNA polymerase Y family protein [Gemmatimonadales bacterium]